MKKYFFLAVAAALSVFASCTKADLTVDNTTVVLTSGAAGTTDVAYSTVKIDAVSATSDADWLQATVGQSAITLSYTQNNGNTRTANVKVEGGSFVITISVEQPTFSFDNISQFNEKWGLAMKPITQADRQAFENCESYNLYHTYTDGTDEMAIRVANFLEKKVFPAFGDKAEEFISNNLPADVYVVNDLQYAILDSDGEVISGVTAYTVKEDSEKTIEETIAAGKKPSLLRISKTVLESEGWFDMYGVSTNFQLTLSADVLDSNSETEVASEYTSYIVERLMSRAGEKDASGNVVYPVPDDFIAVTTNAWAVENPSFWAAYFPVYSANPGLPYTGMELYATCVPSLCTSFPDGFEPWTNCGLLKPARIPYAAIYYYTDEYLRIYNKYFKAEDEEDMKGGKEYMVINDTWQADFANYVAFILWTTEAEKAAVYAAADACELPDATSWGALREYVIQKGSELVKEKQKLVTEYFQKNFGITLSSQVK